MPRKYSRFTAPAKQQSIECLRGVGVIILAEEMGYRMKSYGPKCLIETKTGTILSDQIKTIQKVFHDPDIVLLTGFQADKIVKKSPKGIRIVENQLYQDTNSVEGLRLCFNNMSNNSILIISGDLIFNEHALNSIANEGSCVIIDSKNRISNDEIGVSTNNDRILNFAYGLDSIWCGIVFLQGKELQMAKNFCTRDNSKMCSFEMLNYVINSGGKIRHIEPQNLNIAKISSVKDFHILRKNGEHSHSFKIDR